MGPDTQSKTPKRASMSRVILEMERKPYLRAFRKKFPKNRLLWLYGVAAFVSFTVFVVFWCTNIFRDAVLSTLELRNGSSGLVWWERPPVTLVYKIYIFNYTNVQEFENGSASKLRLQELGPYIYREHLSRVNVEMHANHSVTYQEKRTFTWEAGRMDDEVVVVPNIPLMAALAFSRNMNFVAQLGLTALLTTIQAKPFVSLPAKGFLWGYDDKIFLMAKPFMSMEKLPFDKFGVLANKNGLNPDRITIYTGVGDHSTLGMIQSINGISERNVWGDKECDAIYGTDGSMFPPDMLRDRNNTIYVYSKDICRKVPFRYDSRTISNGIPAYRYKLPEDLFTLTRNKDACFCAKTHEDEPDDISNSRICPPTGIFNTSQCNDGFPLLVSFPHFYRGDPSLFQYLDGLKPQARRHETYFDMHPRLSVPISGWSRFQMNVEVRKGSSMPLSGKVKDGTILPLVWLEVGIESVPEDVHRTLYAAHYLASALEACCQWVSMIALIFLLFGFVTTLRKKEPIEHTCIPSVDSAVEQTKLPE